VVELVPGAALTPEAVIAAVTSRIASYKKPRFVQFVEKLPRKPNGELDRQAVKSSYG